MSTQRIAVVGIACRYPDAESPTQMWENVLAGRRAFRRLPDERMRQEDYYSPDPSAPDRFYSTKAAVIEGWEFDRVKYKIAGSTYRSTDLTHWLALDTAAKALADAGFADGDGLPRKGTGVIIGNTLTGEFSRANILRLRWPYVRRTVGAALREEGWDDGQLTFFLNQLEARYKQPFPPIDEDTLAGGLANTISGRICNYFDFGGGGFTVDGACSSSLLSVATACNALVNGELDAAIAGGVDLSIDPFEVIGFAKTGALAKGEMRVYDKHSSGFWPGEGCGMLVLMRDEDAVAKGLRRYATIAGWGWSSDGKGGITRPEAEGHLLAIKRAYAKAGFGIDTVSYLEGHGTGTAVGDETELNVFTTARRTAAPDAPPAAISTVKGNIGHTKAAAGVAGLIKAVLAVRHQIIPPGTSHIEPAKVLTGDKPALRVPNTAELWPDGQPVRAAVSSMGFGGINAHIVVEHADGPRRVATGHGTEALVRSRQDCELLLIDATSIAELRGKVAQLATLVQKLSFAEIGDLAATLQAQLSSRPIRAAVVATSPEDAERRFGKVLTMLDNGARAVLDTSDGVFIGSAATTPRIGFLFPGQGAGRRGDGGAIRRRFATVDQLYRASGLPTSGDLVATDVAQPRIVTASVAALRVLADLGIEAVVAAGHSLGELTALHWAGAMDEDTLLRTAAARGRIMADASDGDGTMASVAAAPELVEPLLAGEQVVIAGYNSPQQTVISGQVAAVDRVCAKAVDRGLNAFKINVSHAFHSQHVARASVALRAHLENEYFTTPARRIVSTVTADTLPADTDLRDLLARQVLDPVRFTEAVERFASDVDLILEVGPGKVLRGLAGDIAPFVPAISLESDSTSLSGLLNAVAAAYVLGAPVRHDALYADRFTRPLALDKEFRFFASPAEAAPVGDFGARDVQVATVLAGGDPEPTGDIEVAPAEVDPNASSLEILRQLAAERAELPLEAVRPDSQPLDELHLSSITVGQIVNQASKRMGLSAPVATSAFATSTLAELAEMLDQLAGTANAADDEPARAAQGVAPWVRAFAVDLVPTGAGRPSAPVSDGDWRLFASDRHPVAPVLLDALRGARLGSGVLLCLPRDTDEQHVGTMLAAARAVLSMSAPARFVVLGDRRGAAGLARTLFLESPTIPTTLVTAPLPETLTAQEISDLVAMVVTDVAATTGFTEVDYDGDGTRRVPVLRPYAIDSSGDFPLGDDDVLVVTGGGKGITAECALSLAQKSGVALGLLGRSAPEDDEELAENLRRMESAGVRFTYARADVTSADEVKAAVEQVRRTLGPVTAVLHGAGLNQPQGIASLDEATFKRTLAPKIGGLEAVLAATDPAALKLLVTFGSIIGRAGLRGEAHYSTANDWLTDLTRKVGEDYPNCRTVALEWSVWSGAGMGERLGVLESLIREGISPIPTEDGIAILEQVLADPNAPTALVVMGRAEGLPTITLEEQELPLLRFLDRPQVHYPDIELVVDADLTGNGDLYLPDHLLDGDLLFPAVIGMEAMTQAAQALTGLTGAPVLENVEFLRPIVVPVDGSTTVRVAVLATAPGVVQAAIRSGETDFQADHFRATLRFTEGVPVDHQPVSDVALIPLDPAEELYGPVLFQGLRFQRLVGYRRLAAKACVAQIANQSTESWFSSFQPQDLVLADPGTRDALMHSIQCNVPDATLLPAGIERLYLADPDAVRDLDEVTLHANERSRNGDTYIYDLDVRDADGNLVERWQGLKLQAVRKLDGAGPWQPVLLGPYLERRTETVLPAWLSCVVRPDEDDADQSVAARRTRTSEAIGWALGRETEVRYRPDGRPEVDGGVQVSASHGAGVTFAVTTVDGPSIACDVEVATERPADEWERLLGPDQYALAKLVARERGEELSLAATRVWGAVECLRKVGHASIEAVTVGEPRSDRWVVFRSGAARIATFHTTLRDVTEQVVFTMLTEGDD